MRRLLYSLNLVLLFGASASAQAPDSVAHEAYTVEYAYDALGRLTAATYGGDAFPERMEIVYGYDVRGNRVSTKAGPMEPVGNEPDPSVPAAFALHAPTPNPFTDGAVVRFDVKEPVHVRLLVFDVLGREVLTLADGRYDAGQHQASIQGARLSSGIYFCRVEMGDYRATARLVRLR